MDHFYSPSTGGFYSEAVHGSRQIADPQTEKQIKAGRKPVYRANPGCQIPADAVAVDDATWTALMAAQGEGKVIAVEAGRVVTIDKPLPTAVEQLASIRAKRDRLLGATDVMLAVPDYPLSADQRGELVEWRAALRDFPDLVARDLPAQHIAWPARPSWLGENGQKL